jgi:hypothetical protein
MICRKGDSFQRGNKAKEAAFSGCRPGINNVFINLARLSSRPVPSNQNQFARSPEPAIRPSQIQSPLQFRGRPIRTECNNRSWPRVPRAYKWPAIDLDRSLLLLPLGVSLVGAFPALTSAPRRAMRDCQWGTLPVGRMKVQQI